jgi:uncharacterized metal-binding protein YceD (DUF177 family)
MTHAKKQGSTSRIFVAKTDELDRAPIRISRDIPLGWLAHELEACEYETEPIAGQASLTVEKCSQGALVRGAVTARIQIQCGTCLAKSALELCPQVSCYLQPRTGQGEEASDAELTPEDLEREWYEGDTIVLDSLIRDTIMLELPMNPRCQRDCPGPPGEIIAPPAAEIDPRLAPLASIKLSKE